MILATIIPAYMLIGLVVGILLPVAHKLAGKEPNGYDTFIGVILAPFVWPIALPELKDNLKRCRKAKKQTELFKGVDKPSYILAQMLAQKILMHPEKTFYSTWSFEGYVVDLYSYGPYIEVKTPNGEFTYTKQEDKKALDILLEALSKAREIGEKRRVAEKEAKKESEALEAIEGLLGLKVKDCQFSCCNPEAKRKLLEKQRKGL